MKKIFSFFAALLVSAVMWAVDGTYELCTSISDLVAGEHYIIANGIDGDVDCMAVTSNSNNRKCVAAIANESTIDVTAESGILTLTLGGETGAWTFHTDNYGGTNGYLASAVSGKNNYCRVIADLTTATISFSEGAAVINLQPHTERTLLRYNPNNGTPLFACYSSGQQDIYLYKKNSTTPAKTLTSIAISGIPTKTEYFVGEDFDPKGLTVTGTYSDASVAAITSNIDWTADPATFTEASEEASVSVIAKVGDIESPAFVVNGIVVNEKVIPTGFASVYTSNVELTAGENSGAAVINYDGAAYDGVKCGTSSKAGSCTTTIPVGTKTLHFHAIGWKGAASTTLTVNGTEYTIAPDDGITGNPPFTLVGDAFNHYYTFDPQGATEITFASSKRFVVFGVNAELEEGPGTNLNEVKAAANTVKVMREGRIFIMREGKLFNLQGMNMK